MKKIIFIKRAFSYALSLIYTVLIKWLYSNIKIGKGTIVYYKSSIVNLSGSVTIGKRCKIGVDNITYHAGMPFSTRLLVDKKDANITIGDNCRINGASIHAKNRISIGNNCVFASGISIMDSNGHEVFSKNRTTGEDIPEPIVIGNNVWIGLNAVILKGTQIGDNSVVAAGSVIKGVFPNNSIIAGNPARKVRDITELI